MEGTLSVSVGAQAKARRRRDVDRVDAAQVESQGNGKEPATASPPTEQEARRFASSTGGDGKRGQGDERTAPTGAAARILRECGFVRGRRGSHLDAVLQSPPHRGQAAGQIGQGAEVGAALLGRVEVAAA
jgi:hypothetical protein